MKHILLFICFCFCCKMQAQPGCVDPQATNYSSTATSNDGSCVYATTNYGLSQKVILSSTIDETSGLAYLNGKLWTHNDSGSDPLIFRLDSANGSVLQTVPVNNATNKDWEDLAYDSTYLYIGDFGNNASDRTDLKIYRVLRSTIVGNNPVFASEISFTYSDQTAFPPPNGLDNYDCEAFVVYGDSLHLFTKNRGNLKTNHYVLPKTPGTYVAELRDSLDVNGLITGADAMPNGEILLTGYGDNPDPSNPVFLWLLFDFNGNDVFSGNKRRIELGNVVLNGQVEAVTYATPGYGYISAERLSILQPKLFTFTTGQWTYGVLQSLEKGQFTDFAIYPSPATDVCYMLSPVRGDWQLNDLQGKQLLSGDFLPNEPKRVELSGLASGLYFMQVETAIGRGTRRLMVR